MPAEITLARNSAGSLNCYCFLVRHFFLPATAIACLGILIPSLTHASASTSEVRAALQASLERTAPPLHPAESSGDIFIREFYAKRNFAPAWSDEKRLTELGQLARLAELHGLDPNDYRLPELAQTLNTARTTESLQELVAVDRQVTVAIARLASHLRWGKVDQSGRYPELRTADSTYASHGRELLDMVNSAAESATLFAYLNGLPPDTLLYRRMLTSLAQHRRELAAGRAWPMIPNGRTLETGMTDARVPLLRERLGMNSATVAEPTAYDADVAAAVALFQSRHALHSDGILGRQTLAAMNVSLETRADQLRVNLDAQRWAAMPEHPEYLLINIAQFAMHYVAEGERVQSMRTQVGTRKRPTPAFKSELKSIIANPTWTVPPTIFREDVLPRVKSDPTYLARHNMYAVDDAGRAIETDSIDWQQVDATEFPYRLRSGPWQGNALGRLKFQMPNPYLIYLHDTPSKHLFAADNRAVSSGCIRLEKPEELARLLLGKQRKVGPAKLDGALAATGTRFIGLDRPVPVVVMYGTVDLDAQGELLFASDIYRHDVLALTALNSVTNKQPETLLVAQLEAPAAASETL